MVSIILTAEKKGPVICPLYSASPHTPVPALVIYPSRGWRCCSLGGVAAFSVDKKISFELGSVERELEGDEAGQGALLPLRLRNMYRNNGKLAVLRWARREGCPWGCMWLRCCNLCYSFGSCSGVLQPLLVEGFHVVIKCVPGSACWEEPLEKTPADLPGCVWCRCCLIYLRSIFRQRCLIRRDTTEKVPCYYLPCHFRADMI